MKREEQIKEAARLYDDPYTEANDYRSFVDGCHWADEHPKIDKVCEWLKPNLDCYVEVEGEHAFETNLKIHTDLLIEDLKKFIEE